MKDGKCPICKTMAVLVIVGALNWGSVGLFGNNFVEQLLAGFGPAVIKTVYILVGISGLVLLVSCFKACPACKK